MHEESGNNGVQRTSGLRRFVSMIDQYFNAGGAQMQFNVVSKKTLLDAQKTRRTIRILLYVLQATALTSPSYPRMCSKTS